MPRSALSAHRRVAGEDSSGIAKVMVFVLISIPADDPIA